MPEFKPPQIGKTYAVNGHISNTVLEQNSKNSQQYFTSSTNGHVIDYPNNSALSYVRNGYSNSNTPTDSWHSDNMVEKETKAPALIVMPVQNMCPPSQPPLRPLSMPSSLAHQYPNEAKGLLLREIPIQLQTSHPPSQPLIRHPPIHVPPEFPSKVPVHVPLDPSVRGNSSKLQTTYMRPALPGPQLSGPRPILAAPTAKMNGVRFSMQTGSKELREELGIRKGLVSRLSEILENRADPPD